MKLRRTIYFNLSLLAVIFIIISAGYFFGQNFLTSQSAVYLANAQTDTVPPVLAEVKIADISTSTANITWKTDEATDALVNYSLDKNYGISRDSTFVNTKHKISVENLKPDTTYYFRVISSDPYGNQAISGDYSLTTKSDESAPVPEKTPDPVKNDQTPQDQQQAQDQSSQKITNDVIDMLEKITNPEDLLKIQDTIEGIAGGELNPPAVLGAAPEIELGSDFAIIRWVTDRKTDSIVALASEAQFRPNADDPYSWKQGEPSEQVLEHEVRVGNLSPATTYHYQIISKPELGPEGKSKDFTFKTKSIIPEIYNLKVAKVEEDAATITFNTNVPTKAIVSYTNLIKKETKLAGSSNPVTAHNIRLTNLIFDTTYSTVVEVVNEYDEKATSFPITFTTVKDVLPPVIAKVNTESTIYPGAESKIQTIISWETDELAECQFFYQEGILVKEASFLPKETDYVTKHIQVVTSFTQATVYKYWIKCTDDAGNETTSESFTILTPAQEQSVLDMIIGNFESTFGWLKKK